MIGDESLFQSVNWQDKQIIRIREEGYILMVTNELMAEALIERYKSRDMESRLDKVMFKGLFKDAVKEYFPQLKKEYIGQSIYGISFEIANIVQRVYFDDFYTIVYFNTEEMYKEKVKDCDEDEKEYYRFEPWAEWEIISPKSSLFEKVQDYLKQNSLNLLLDHSDYSDGLSEEVAVWCKENEMEMDDAFEKEREQIRLWVAEALGELRKEGFWDSQGNVDIYVIPFSGECDIDYEEMVQTFKEMDQDCHGTEYLDYLAEQEMD